MILNIEGKSGKGGGYITQEFPMGGDVVPVAWIIIIDNKNVRRMVNPTVWILKPDPKM